MKSEYSKNVLKFTICLKIIWIFEWMGCEWMHGTWIFLFLGIDKIPKHEGKYMKQMFHIVWMIKSMR